MLVYLVIFLGGEIVKYRLLLLIIRLTELGPGMLVPPSLPLSLLLFRDGERGLKREMRRERKNTPGSAVAAKQGLPGNDRREEVKVKVKAARGGTALW